LEAVVVSKGTLLGKFFLAAFEVLHFGKKGDGRHAFLP
jgi:hypothetical protein